MHYIIQDRGIHCSQMEVEAVVIYLFLTCRKCSFMVYIASPADDYFPRHKAFVDVHFMNRLETLGEEVF